MRTLVARAGKFAALAAATGALVLAGSAANAAAGGQGAGTQVAEKKVNAAAYRCVTGDGVNYRTGPGTGYPSLGHTNYGQGVTVLRYQSGWYNVDLWGPGADSVWIHSQYIGWC